jgi:hypothetical protein
MIIPDGFRIKQGNDESGRINKQFSTGKPTAKVIVGIPLTLVFNKTK